MIHLNKLSMMYEKNLAVLLSVEERSKNLTEK